MNAIAISAERIVPLPDEKPGPGITAGTSDAELLRSYVRSEKAESFTTLLQRHWSLVYGVAYRRTRNAALAQDIAQAVFIVLERKCRSFSEGTVLAGWLFRTTMFTANNILKAESRRREREEQAALDFATTEIRPAEVWDAMAKDLDEGLASLPTNDRNALILRFLQDRSFGEVGEAIGSSEEGARQRCLRALEKLRRFLRKRGIVYPIGMITLAFGAQPSEGAAFPRAASNRALSLAAQTLAGMRRKRGRIIAAFALAVVLCGLVTMAWSKFDRRETLAKRRAIEAVDMTLWRGDGVGFSASINFGKADPDRAQRSLAYYAVALHRLRESFEQRFESASGFGGMTPLTWLAGNKIRQQPLVNSHDHAVNPMVAGYSMRLIREHGVWKWDLFENATETEINSFLGEIDRQAAIFERFRDQVELGDFQKAEEVLWKVQKEIDRGTR